MCKLFWEMAIKEPWPKEARRFEATKVNTDSDAAFSIAVKKQASAMMKHIPLKFYFVLNFIACREVVFLIVSSKANIADMLMKIIDFPTMKHLCDLMGLS